MATLPIGPHRVEEMLAHLLDLSRQMMEKNGGVAPFGAVIDNSGDRHLVAAEIEEKDFTAQRAFEIIAQGMRAQFFKGEIVAGAIVAEASVPPELGAPFSDSIRIHVESSSICRLIFLPFSRVKQKSTSAEKLPPKVHYSELLGVNIRPKIFAPPEQG